MKISDIAPDFELLSQHNTPVRLSSFYGKSWVVLFFYPKDNTPGCTTESCAFRDSYAVFQEAGAEVIGISADSPESHRAFAAHHHLPFLLLSDPENQVRNHYRVPKTFGLLPGRVTFVIDPQGIIRYRFDSQFRPHQHIQNTLAFIRTHQDAQ